MNLRQKMQALLDGKPLRIKATHYTDDKWILLRPDGELVNDRGYGRDAGSISLTDGIWTAPNPHYPGTFAWARYEATENERAVRRPGWSSMLDRTWFTGQSAVVALEHLDATDWEHASD